MIDSSSRETELQSEEIKPSWSFKYIVLAIVVSIANIILGGIIGYFLKYIFDPSERRILTVTETQTENLLNLDQKVYDEIITIELTQVSSE